MGQINPFDNYFLQKEDPDKSCLQFLRQLILKQDRNITEAWKYGMPFFCYKGKMFCYLTYFPCNVYGSSSPNGTLFVSSPYLNTTCVPLPNSAMNCLHSPQGVMFLRLDEMAIALKEVSPSLMALQIAARSAQIVEP